MFGLRRGPMASAIGIQGKSLSSLTVRAYEGDGVRHTDGRRGSQGIGLRDGFCGPCEDCRGGKDSNENAGVNEAADVQFIPHCRYP